MDEEENVYKDLFSVQSLLISSLFFSTIKDTLNRLLQQIQTAEC